MKILIVDDAEPVRTMLGMCFTALGHEVVELGSGREVERTLGTAQFDAVFSDVAMPDMSGWDVLRLVRTAQPAAPVVLMTGWEVTQPPPGSADLAPDGVLHKPFSLDRVSELLEAVTRAH